MKKYFLLILLLPLSILNAQELKVDVKAGNISNLINDGFIDLEVSGGEPPYTNKWSDQNTGLESKSAYGLTEGISYKVKITDSEGTSLTREFKIKPKAITEHFNGAAVPLVESLGNFLFWDPFTAFGIYDPVVYAEVAKVPIPNWSPSIEDRYLLKEWKVNEGEKVNEGDLIAIVNSENQGDLNIYANTNGSLKHLTKTGDVIYDSNNSDDLIKAGAHNLAEIKYPTPLPVAHPNGDPQTHNIPLIVIWLIFGAAFFYGKNGFYKF